MRKELNIGPIRVYIGIQRMTWVDGVNSLLEDGNHFLMWDFDGVGLNKVIDSLMEVQRENELPTIYILETGRPDSFHAYCWKRLMWTEAMSIVWRTPHVCQTFVKMAFIRGYFTLRFSVKSGRGINFVQVLPSYWPEDVNPHSVRNFVRYCTKGG